jgi:hypothetical protein
LRLAALRFHFNQSCPGLLRELTYLNRRSRPAMKSATALRAG